jgi:mannose-1-phosphate guanylyltransferase
MLPVGGRPMIERVLERLHADGVDEAVLSLGYRPDAFTAAYPDGRCVDVSLHYAVESEPLDTAGAIRFAALEAGIDETFVVVNGDVLTGLDLRSVIRFHRERGAEATIALTPVDDPSRFGVVPTDAAGRVLEFVEKPPPGTAPTNLINAGTYVLEPSVLDRIPAGRRVSIERETFPALVSDGALYAIASDADWVDAGTPATYLAANLEYAADAADLAVRDGSVRIAESATIKGSVLGDAVTVGAGAVVDGSVLLDGVTVGRDAEIRSSIVGPGAHIGEGASVTDLTVVGNAAVVAAGSRLAGGRHPDAP